MLAHRDGSRRCRRSPRYPRCGGHDDRAGRGVVRRVRNAAGGDRARRGDARASARRNRPGARRDAGGHTMTPAVLVVDDSLTVRMDLAEAFEAAELTAIGAATAAEARDSLARLPIAAVVLDVVLPDGDGV